MMFSNTKSNKFNQTGTLLLIDEKEILQLKKVDMLKLCCIKIGRNLNMFDSDLGSKLVELEQLPLLMVDDTRY